MTNPTPEQAHAFCVMLNAGLPAEQAILYFIDSEDPLAISLVLAKWQRSKEVGRAAKALLGKDWQDLTTDEMIDKALDQHYRSLAWFLRSTNYTSAGQVEKQKLDSARTALEAKKAGTAGKTDALSAFYADMKAGKFNLAVPKIN